MITPITAIVVNNATQVANLFFVMIVTPIKDLVTGTVYERSMDAIDPTLVQSLALHSGEYYRALGMSWRVQGGALVRYAIVCFKADEDIGWQITLLQESNFNIIDLAIPPGWRCLTSSAVEITFGFEIVRDLEALHELLFTHDQETVDLISKLSIF